MPMRTKTVTIDGGLAAAGGHYGFRDLPAPLEPRRMVSGLILRTKHCREKAAFPRQGQHSYDDGRARNSTQTLQLTMAKYNNNVTND